MGGLLWLVLPALFSAAVAQCGLGELEWCTTEFAGFISPRGITLSEQNLARACTVRNETVDCMDMFLQQCLKNETDSDNVMDLITKTTNFINRICPSTSDFVSNLKSNEGCILNSSESFQSCYNKSYLPDSKGPKADLMQGCCRYKNLRNCAVQTVEDKCGAAASQVVHEEVVNINGVVAEWVCEETFEECENSAVMLASSIFFVLLRVAFFKILF